MGTACTATTRVSDLSCSICKTVKFDILLSVDWQSSSRMRVMNHSWSATKQYLHPQSVADISCHSVLSEDRIQQCGTSSESHHKDIWHLLSNDESAIDKNLHCTCVTCDLIFLTIWAYSLSALYYSSMLYAG